MCQSQRQCPPLSVTHARGEGTWILSFGALCASGAKATPKILGWRYVFLHSYSSLVLKIKNDSESGSSLGRCWPPRAISACCHESPRTVPSFTTTFQSESNKDGMSPPLTEGVCTFPGPLCQVRLPLCALGNPSCLSHVELPMANSRAAALGGRKSPRAQPSPLANSAGIPFDSSGFFSH